MQGPEHELVPNDWDSFKAVDIQLSLNEQAQKAFEENPDQFIDQLSNALMPRVMLLLYRQQLQHERQNKAEHAQTPTPDTHVPTLEAINDMKLDNPVEVDADTTNNQLQVHPLLPPGSSTQPNTNTNPYKTPNVDNATRDPKAENELKAALNMLFRPSGPKPNLKQKLKFSFKPTNKPKFFPKPFPF